MVICRSAVAFFSLAVSWFFFEFVVVFWVEILFFLQIDFTYYANNDLLVAFHCDHQVSYR